MLLQRQQKSSMQNKRPIDRPKNLNLFTIKLPLNALVSILHRASGVGLFLILPLALYLFQQSVSSQASYQSIVQCMGTVWFKVIVTGLSFAFFHHFYAGIRHLLQDVHWMTSLQKARMTGRFVLMFDAISVLGFVWWLWF